MEKKDYREEKNNKAIGICIKYQFHLPKALKDFQSLRCVHVCERFKTNFKNIAEFSRNNG